MDTCNARGRIQHCLHSTCYGVEMFKTPGDTHSLCCIMCSDEQKLREEIKEKIIFIHPGF